VERFDQRCRAIAHAAHSRLYDLPALIVAWREWLGVKYWHCHLSSAIGQVSADVKPVGLRFARF